MTKEQQKVFVKFMDIINEFELGISELEEARKQIGELFKVAMTNKIMTELDCRLIMAYGQTPEGKQKWSQLKLKIVV
jgi:hypothetical protein